ncbi:E3 ubiquitin-protein ligase TRIM21-like [Takifugu flavidus]|uniref:E3 ubiquitin-protein ligase TRIM68 n=1 Tax=Takifugu flavidus TaxID=433684 RepID=A0A5C6NDX7_9TELE|nr:E3 ubiquitin-protein ligase TRIM21-like [Takifugu flavidus]XP_056878719.1 E3 ubiquitin-protein ligase TRIM21-like [Takifugu flavidus]XP_056878721.1 E3 ubiquitin-protein ligase TRIM21-like [Takifugu flavidus]TWW64929.1 E3 ubiquitin-protein ligase TRIM68 [Takifugu flavidus]
MEEKLLKTLLELNRKEFKTFKWFLKQKKVLRSFSGIPVALLETAERTETVDLMVQKYQDSGALEVTLEVLRKVSRNDLVEDLLEETKHFKENPQNEYERTKAELKEKMEQMIQDRRMKIEEIRCSAAISKKSAERHISDSERTFRVLLENIKRSQDSLVEDIGKKQRSTQKQADGLIQKLEQEIQLLTNTCQEVERPSAPAGSRRLLLSVPTMGECAGVSIDLPSYGREVASTLKALEERLSNEKEKLIAKAKLFRVQEFSKDVTLDPDTANEFLVLSDDKKQVHFGSIPQKLPENPRRFEKTCNVLGRPSCSSGRFYFQVQVEGLASWDLGMVRESVQRTGSITASPHNGFWTICLRDNSNYRAHGQRLCPKLPPKKVGVFVDYEDACVSFFDVDSADLIHQFTQCSFSEQLCPFFSPGRLVPNSPSHSLAICPVDYDF